jgi:hypothetical protein
MAISPFPQPKMPVSHDDDIFCSDPNCPYCRDLRVAQEEWKKAQKESQNRAGAQYQARAA